MLCLLSEDDSLSKSNKGWFQINTGFAQGVKQRVMQVEALTKNVHSYTFSLCN